MVCIVVYLLTYTHTMLAMLWPRWRPNVDDRLVKCSVLYHSSSYITYSACPPTYSVHIRTYNLKIEPGRERRETRKRLFLEEFVLVGTPSYLHALGSLVLSLPHLGCGREKVRRRAKRGTRICYCMYCTVLYADTPVHKKEEKGIKTRHVYVLYGSSVTSYPLKDHGSVGIWYSKARVRRLRCFESTFVLYGYTAATWLGPSSALLQQGMQAIRRIMSNTCKC